MGMAARGRAGGWTPDPACRTESRVAASRRGWRVRRGRSPVLGSALSLLLVSAAVLLPARTGRGRATHRVRPAGNGSSGLVLLPERSRLLSIRTELPRGVGESSTEDPMTVRWTILPVGVCLLLSACASVPTGPSVMVLPGNGRNFEQFRADDADCRQWALYQTGTTPNKAGTTSAVTGAAVGTVVGAGLGAAIGAAAGSPATGAAVGAGAGLLGGTAVGAGNAYGACMPRAIRFLSPGAGSRHTRQRRLHPRRLHRECRHRRADRRRHRLRDLCARSPLGLRAGADGGILKRSRGR